jgi:3-phenylpropionate/cinnamic acid dioxygenase small subunit
MQVAAPSRQEVEALLYREARLLDERRFEEWLELFTEDAHYWCPANADDTDPQHDVSFLYDDRARMGDRVWRLLHSGAAWSQTPPSKTRRLITNVEVLDGEDGDVLVYSNFVIVEARRGKQTLLGGQYEHHLRRGEDGWRIAYKKVSLVNNDLPIENLTLLV